MANVQSIRNKTGNIKKYHDINYYLDSALLAGQNIARNDAWIAEIHLRRIELGFESIESFIVFIAEALRNWNHQMGLNQYRELLMNALNRVMSMAYNLVIDARYFAMSRGICRNSLDYTISLTSVAREKMNVGDATGAIAALKEAWIVFSQDTPEVGIGIPKLLNIGFSSSSIFRAIGWSTDPCAKVLLYIDGNLAGEGLADSSGGFGFQSWQEVPDGLHTISINVEDEDCNTANLDPVDILFDTATPTPEITSPLSGSHIWQNPSVIIGQGAEPGATIYVHFQKFSLITTADEFGNFSVQPETAIEEGPYQITASPVDSYGNISYTPKTDFVLGDFVQPITIEYPTEGLLTHSTTIQILGKGALAGGRMHLSLDAVGRDFVKADEYGSFCFTVESLTVGKHWLYVGGKRIDGEYAFTKTINFILCDVANTPAITYPASGGVIPPGSIIISGDALMPRAEVVVWLDGELAGWGIAQTNGMFNIESQIHLSKGTHRLVVRAIKAKGAPAFADAYIDFFCTEENPPGPLVPPSIVEPVQDSVIGISTPIIRGNAPSSSTVEIYIDSVFTNTAPVISGAFEYPVAVPLTEGNHNVYAISVGFEGSRSEPSTIIHFIVDTIIGKPYISYPATESILADNTPEISGSGTDAGATIEVYIDGIVIGTTEAGSAGGFTFQVIGPLSEGAHQLYVWAYDAAGNKEESDLLIFTVDTLPPTQPVISSPKLGETTGLTPLITGTTEAGSEVFIFIDGLFVATAFADVAGSFNLVLTKPIVAGWHTVSAKARDMAGNYSQMSLEVEFYAVP